MKHLKFLIVTLVIVLGFFIYYEYSKINDLWAIESPTMGDTCANNGFIKCDNEAELFINQVEFQDMQNNEPDLLILNLTNNGAMDINVGWHLIIHKKDEERVNHAIKEREFELPRKTSKMFVIDKTNSVDFGKKEEFQNCGDVFCGITVVPIILYQHKNGDICEVECSTKATRRRFDIIS